MGDVLQMRELTAEDIFGAQDETLAACEVPEWQKAGKPGIVYFKAMSAAALIEFRKVLADAKTRPNGMVRLFADTACDSKGNLLFSGADVVRLKERNSKVFMRLQNFLMQMNMMRESTKTWETVEEILTAEKIESAVIERVKAKWEAVDEDAVKNVLGEG